MIGKLIKSLIKIKIFLTYLIMVLPNVSHTQYSKYLQTIITQ